MTELLVNAAIGEMRIALVKDGSLADFQVERENDLMLTGNIYLGRVARVMLAMQAAFVEIGTARPGFLALHQAQHLADKPDPGISDCVREGEAIVVQVIREAQGGKGPALNAALTLAPELQARRKIARVPSLLARAPSLLERMLCDLPGDAARIAIDDARTASAARSYCRGNRPELEARVETVRQAFDDALEEDIARLSDPRVKLAGGGWIAIEATEGFTAIDVNSGGFAASEGREETSVAVNLQAAQEIGRQIRLRGIGGLIVVDFIQMQDAASTRLVESVLAESLGSEVPTDITLSRTGLAVVTRKRVRTPLSRFWEDCACCNGAGARPTTESVALALLRAAETSAHAAPGREVVAYAAPEVVEWLTAHREALALARRGIGRLRLEIRQGPREGFDVSTS